MNDPNDISSCVEAALNTYFRNLDGEKPRGVYDMVLKCVERPMLAVVMRQAEGKQTLAAEMLGINRNTLRKKLSEHGLL